ncbi:type IV secretory system conjugative DNA transfer family protein [Actinokineospora bangkokensis]|uniref:Type IV secretion system coupling protein TraD DNA-binding domain-containing protein n=1 Tax=Actinokineospora bangkokensis TaxID=1193682 RepID=A0A1Q9LC10_9PSEU|nr:type IV secretory system conjugative DNA transfer family protein [Actinokineospora bangkokensis]OLR89554.1 hypothetical protein BJP25_05615 [Actinokineospora bangkokensis]
MADPSALVFSSLHLPRPMEAADLASFLHRLAADRQAPRLVLEARADQGGVRYLLGAARAHLTGLRRLLVDLLPGSSLAKASPRLAVDTAVRLKLSPRSLPLLTDRPEATTRALLSALSVITKKGEQLVLQVVLGPRRAPVTVAEGTADPDTSLTRLVLGMPTKASPETRQRLKARVSHSGFALTIRLGVTAADPARRQRLVLGLLSAIATAQSPGVRISTRRQHPRAIERAEQPLRWPLRLAVDELVGLLALPIGGGELPGLPPLHPKPLRAAKSVHGDERVFVQSAVPGDDRTLGISAKDQTFHGITYGPSGSGKTTAMLSLIMADINAGRAVAVLDPKRQLIDDILARTPKSRWDDVVEINPGEPGPVTFNPLDVSGRDPDVVVDGILAVFEHVFHDGWGPRSSDIFSATLRTLARAAAKGLPATLLDLPQLLVDPAVRRRYVGHSQDDLALAGFWAWYESQSPQAQAAAIAAPLNKLRQFLLRPALTRILGDPEPRFKLRNLFRDKRILLVPLNDGLIGPGTASLLGSLIIADLWQATQERAAEPDANAHPATIVVDEAPRFLHLGVGLADALAVSRSLSVGWFLAAQFRDQFPPALRSAVDMNARSKLIFATEYDDARDMARLARELSVEDFTSLPRWHAYANLVAQGHPSGWALVKTLPPSPPITDPAEVRARIAANFAPLAPPSSTGATPTTSPPTLANPMNPVVGRKRRSS